MDSEYKANRPAAPDDFKQQIPLIHELVSQLKIPSLWEPGYEADDIINTLAKSVEDWELQVDGKDLEAMIISSDKDLKQLISDKVRMKDPMKDIIFTTKSFIQEYGFEPKLMLDYLALMGDAADNIKWVPGVGPKTASKLIQDYQTMENIYANIDNIPDKTRKKLIDGQKSAKHSKLLVELIDVPNLKYKSVSDLKLDVDIGNYRQTLVQWQGFNWLSKVLDDLKKKYAMPQQSSLF